METTVSGGFYRDYDKGPFLDSLLTRCKIHICWPAMALGEQFARLLNFYASSVEA